MTAIETICEIMEANKVSLSELSEYADLGSKSNVHQMLNRRKDLKVGTFVKMLEALGYQLIAQSEETDEEFILDYEE